MLNMDEALDLIPNHPAPTHLCVCVCALSHPVYGVVGIQPMVLNMLGKHFINLAPLTLYTLFRL